MRTIVIGGGIGGLTLAAGLRRRGDEVVVIERDTDLTATGGYHLHLSGVALAALSTALAPSSVEDVYASSAAGHRQGPDIVRDMRGRLLAESSERDEADSVNIDRITLRLILADAAGDSLRTGTTCTGFEQREDGTVLARLDDGSDVVGDVVVGADGTGSLVSTALAGGPTSDPVGLLGVGGRTSLDVLAPEVVDLLGTRSGLAVGPRGTGLYIGYHDPVGHAAVQAGAVARSTRPTYIWGAIVPESTRTRRLRGLAGADLRDVTIAMLRDQRWSDRMLEVVRRTDLEGVATFRFHASSPDPARLAPWSASTVTALGDAVHAMPPTAGMGAATAICDAAALLHELGLAAAGSKTVRVAVHDFEVSMRARGARAVGASLGPIGWIRRADTTVGAAAARVALPAMAGLSSLTRARAGLGKPQSR